jgi:hypothetical protein
MSYIFNMNQLDSIDALCNIKAKTIALCKNTQGADYA